MRAAGFLGSARRLGARRRLAIAGEALRKGGLDDLLRTRVDQVHLVHVGDERHGFAGALCRGRGDASANLGAGCLEIDHRLHAHRLDDFELCSEPAEPGRHRLAARLGDVLRPQPEKKVGAEMLAASDWGLGWVIFDAKEFINADVMLASLIVIGAIGFVFERLVFGSLERATVLRCGMVRGAKS